MTKFDEGLYFSDRLLAREDGSPFTLSDEDLHNGIIDALYKFLSFQCEAWVTISTIVCNSPFEITEKSLSLSYDETDADLIETVRQLVGNSENDPSSLSEKYKPSSNFVIFDPAVTEELH